jgi:hypothetical protein
MLYKEMQIPMHNIHGIEYEIKTPIGLRQ